MTNEDGVGMGENFILACATEFLINFRIFFEYRMS